MNVKADRRRKIPEVAITKTLRIMRLTAILLLVGSFTVSAHGRAQERVTLHLKQVSLETVLDRIQEQTGYNYIFSEKEVHVTQKFDVDVRSATIQAVLDQCLKDQPVTYEVSGKMIKIVNRPVMTSTEEAGGSGPGPFSLVVYVVGEDGNRLAGATVKITALKVEGVTDEKGTLEVKNVAAGTYKVEVTFVGYEKREAQVNVKDLHQTATVGLKRATARLDAVQIIAYGQTTERLSTGDVTTVDAKEIEAQPVSNAMIALEGRVPGLFVTQAGGAPGSGFSVQLRGQNSMLNGNNPFYVVDGVPYPSSLLPNLGYGVWGTNSDGTSGSPLNYINPADIESISILKDADATAIYGSRAANGAVLITTKKGKSGKTRVDLNVSSGIATAPLRVHWLNTPEYLTMRHEAYRNDGTNPTTANAPDLLVWDTTRYTDWQKKLIGLTAHYDDASADFSGGSANTKFLFGAGYHRESTVFPMDAVDQKGSFHFNLNNVSEDRRFQANITANYMLDNSALPASDLTTLVQSLPPDAPPVYNADGSLNWANETWTGNNPYSYLLNMYSTKTNNLIGNATLSYTLLKGLQLKSSFGYTNMEVKEVSTQPIAAQDPAYAPTGNARFTENNINSWIIEPQLSYYTLLGLGRLDALAGVTFAQNNSQGFVENASGFTSDALLTNIQAAPYLLVASTTYAAYKYNAIFGRLGYNLKDEFIFNLDFRRDGSSRFGPDRQFHDFASGAAAWVFTKEGFFKHHMKFLSLGKIRASYGTTGNDQIGDYRFYDLFNTTEYSYQGTIGYTPSGLNNPYLAWEETKKAEVGISLGFLSDRILANGNFYRNRTSNELLNSTLPSITGFVSIPSNLPATVQNSGWEVAINSSNVKSKNFSWSTNFNISLPRNKLVSFPGIASSTYNNSYIVGQPILLRRLYHSLGVNDTTGTYQFLSAKGLPTYTPSSLTDRTSVVGTAPKFYGGLENIISYKGFELAFLFQFTKRTVINYLFAAPSEPGTFGITRPNGVLGRWQGQGQVAPYEKFSASRSSKAYVAYNNEKLADGSMMDGSFIRLKNVSLSYAIPGEWLKKNHVSRLILFVRGENLLTWTKYNGLDPENLNGAVLPPLRVLTGGVTVSL